MRLSLRARCLAAAAMLLLGLASSADAQRFSTTRVNTTAQGGQAAGPIDPPGTASASGDGRYVAFDTGATNLVSGDTNGVLDVYVKDRTTGEIVRVSRGLSGTEPNARSFGPSISRDGRWIAFYSNASNLVAGDTNGLVDTFVFDRLTLLTVRVSLSSADAEKTWPTPSDENDFIPPGSSAVISATGRFVVFNSRAANLVSGDTNAMIDVFVRDRNTDGNAMFDEPGGVSTTRVSIATDGTQGNANSYAEAITPDGRHVSFVSYASTLVAGDTNVDPDQSWLSLIDVFVRDRNTDGNAVLDEPGSVRTVRVNLTSGGEEVTSGRSVGGGLSDNGRFVVYGSSSDEIVPEDSNGKEDVFVHDRNPDGNAVFDEPGETSTVRISVSTGGEEANNAVDHGDGYYAASISATGRFISFTSESTNLAANDHNGQSDIFVRDRDVDSDGLFDEAGAVSTSRVSVASDDNEQVQSFNSYSTRSVISADGRIVVFWSSASNLVPGDTNGLKDLFAFDRLAWSLTSLTTPTTVELEVSGDGRWVLFESAGHIYVRDRSVVDAAPGAVRQMDVDASGVPAAGSSSGPAISDDGRIVVFSSTAANLVPGDTNLLSDVFVRDRDPDLDGVFDEAGQVRVFRASVAIGGAQATGGPSDGASVSPNGEWIAFSSAATNLGIAGLGFRQVYVHNRVTRVTIGISHRNGVGGNGDSIAPSVANNGVVAFQSTSSSLDTIQGGDTNGQPDVYVSIPPSLIGQPSAFLYAMSRHRDIGELMPTASGTAPVISADGYWVAFTSIGDLESGVGGTTTPFTNVYFGVVHAGPFPYTRRVSRTATDPMGNGHSRGAVITPIPGVPDKYYLHYVSDASNLVPNDTNTVSDVFRAELTIENWGPSANPFLAGRRASVDQTTRVSVSPDGAQLAAATADVRTTRSGTISVMTSGDRETSQRQSLATISRVEPNEGPVQGGTRITIYGTGLGDGYIVPRFVAGAEELDLLFDDQTRRGDGFLEAITPPISAPPRAFGISITDRNNDKRAIEPGPLETTFQYRATPCTVSAGAPSNAIPPAGGTATVLIQGTEGCRWGVGERPTWVTVSPETGTAGEAITLTAAANPEHAPRSGVLSVANTDVIVSQAAAACAPSLRIDGRPASDITIGSTTTTAAVELWTGETCGWGVDVVGDGESWLVRTTPASGSGTTVIAWSVQPNTSLETRHQTFAIAGLPFVLHQSPASSHTLTATPPNGGRIVAASVGLDCGTQCIRSVGQGAQVTLTAAPSQHYAFDRWTGDCAFADTTPVCTLAISGNHSVGALFRQALPEEHRLTIAIAGSGAGTVTGSDLACPGTCERDYPDGTIVSLTRTSAAGSSAGVWSPGCGDVMTMSATRVCTVTFNSLQSTDVVLTVEVAGNGAGTVTSSVGGIVCGAGGSVCSQSFAPGTAVTLTAAASSGSSVGAWEPAACGSGPITLSQSTTCRATFTVDAAPKTLTVSLTGRGRVTSLPTGIDCPGDCSESFPDATVVRLFAVPQAGATLGDWGGACIGRDACSVRLVQAVLVSKAFEDATAAPLTLTEIRPTSGLASGGGKIRVYGSGFAQRDSASVTIGGRPALGVIVLDDSTIVAAVPPLPAPSGPVPASLAHDVVVNVGGATGTITDAFRGIVLTGSATTDTDSDGMPDQWEALMGVDPLVADATVDTDGDGLTNAAEHAAGTHPAGFYRRYLAEGVNNAFFSTRVATANATSVPATTLMLFQRAEAEHSPYTIFTVPGESWDPLESTCRHASLSIL